MQLIREKYCFILFLAIFFSCSSRKKLESEIVVNFMNDKKRIDRFEEIYKKIKIKPQDTIFINCLVKNNKKIKDYIGWFHKDYPLIAPYWIVENEKFILEDDDIRYMNIQISKLKDYKKWDEKKIIFDKFKVFKISLNEKEIIIYSFSEPIINKNKDCAVFYCEYHFNSIKDENRFKNVFIIMKKINKKWTYIGELYRNQIID